MDFTELKNLYKGHLKCIDCCDIAIKTIKENTKIDTGFFVSKVDELKELFADLKCIIESIIRKEPYSRIKLAEVHRKMRSIELEIIEE